MKPGTTIDPMRLQSPVFLPHWQAKVKTRCRRCPENWRFFHFFLDASLCFCSYYLLCNLYIICRICRSTWKMCMCCICIRAFVRWFLGGHVVHVACRKALIVSLSQKKHRFSLKNGLDWSTYASWCFLISATLWNTWAAYHQAQDAFANTDQWHPLTSINHRFSSA